MKGEKEIEPRKVKILIFIEENLVTQCHHGDFMVFREGRP